MNLLSVSLFIHIIFTFGCIAMRNTTMSDENETKSTIYNNVNEETMSNISAIGTAYDNTTLESSTEIICSTARILDTEYYDSEKLCLLNCNVNNLNGYWTGFGPGRSLIDHCPIQSTCSGFFAWTNSSDEPTFENPNMKSIRINNSKSKIGGSDPNCTVSVEIIQAMFCVKENMIIYFLPVYSNAANLCFRNGSMKCPVGYNSDGVNYVNCRKNFPYDSLVNATVEVYNADPIFFQCVVNINESFLLNAQYSEPKGLIQWFIKDSTTQQNVFENATFQYDRISIRSVINILDFVENPILDSNNKTILCDFKTNYTYDSTVSSTYTVNADPVPFNYTRNLKDLSKQLDNIINKTEYNDKDKNLLTSIGQTLLNSSLAQKDEKTIKQALNTINQLLKLPRNLISETQSTSGASTDIIKAAENFLNANITVNITLDNLKAAAIDMNVGSETPKLGIKLENNNSTYLQELNQDDFKSKLQNITYAAYLNEDSVNAYQNSKNGSSIDLYFQIIAYSVDSLFQVVDSSQTEQTCKNKLKSRQVISVNSNIKLKPINGSLVTLLFTEFEDRKESCDKNIRFEYACVYWDFELNNGKGNWSSDGCKSVETNGVYTCTCNHTTNFIILINIFNNKIFPENCTWCDEALLFCSISGSSLSVLFLILSIITFTKLEYKRIRTKRSNQQFRGMNYHYYKLMILLCLHLIIFNLFFIVFSVRNNSTVSNVTCQAIGILLHFFFLCSFFIMSSMSILRYLLTVQVFKDIRHFNLISTLITWALAATIVGITIFVPPGVSKYISPKNMCWLHTPTDMLAVVVPIGLSLLLNLILFIVTIVGLQRNSTTYRHNPKRGFEICRFIVGSVFICGLTWSFGFMAFLIKVPDDWLYFSFALAIIFCLLNGFQGVFIFICTSLIRKHELKDALSSKSNITTELTDLSANSRNTDHID